VAQLWHVVNAHWLIVVTGIAAVGLLFLVLRWAMDSMGLARRECERDEAIEDQRKGI